MCELDPTDIYAGVDDFLGYIVFDYSNSGFSILECPFVGNAIYILVGDWKALSKLSKAELLNFHSKISDRQWISLRFAAVID